MPDMSDRPPKPTDEDMKLDVFSWVDKKGQGRTTGQTALAFSSRAARAEWENAVMRKALEKLEKLKGHGGGAAFIAGEALREVNR